MVREDNQATKEELRKFGMLMGGIIPALFVFLLPWVFSYDMPMWPWVIALPFFIAALIYPAGLRQVYKGWMIFGHGLGWVNSRIILGILFYLIFFPMGVLMRMMKKDPLAKKIERSTNDSYRVNSHAQSNEHFKRPY